jgi:hypothetical protein
MFARTMDALKMQNSIEYFGIDRYHNRLLFNHHTTYIGTVKGSALEISF